MPQANRWIAAPAKTSAPFRGRAAGGTLAIAALALGAALAAAPARAQQSALPCPPRTQTDSVVDNYFGVRVADPYRWLEDQYSPATRAWIKAEDQCTAKSLDGLPGRGQIAKRLGGLMKVDSIDVPIARGGRYFFLKRAAKEDLSILYVRQGPQGKDEVLVDPRPLSPDHSTSVGLITASEDGRVVAYGVRKGGQDEISIHLLDTDTRRPLPDVLSRARYFAYGGGFSITPDNHGLYYSRMTPAGPRVFYHAMGTPAKRDKMIFGQGYGSDKIILASLSSGGRYLLYQVFYGAGSERSEVYLQDVRNHGLVVPVVKGVDAYFDGQMAGDTLFLLTNWKAPNWRIFAMSLKNPARGNWREIVPEGQDAIAGLRLAGGKLLVSYTHDAATALRLFDPDGKPAGEIALPAPGSASGFTSRWKSKNIFFNFRSFAIPPAIYRYNVARRRLEVWARPRVPVESGAFTLAQVWYRSKDGTRVPMFLFYKKGLQRNGENPALLTGYGGFDISLTPNFSAEAVAWAEQGGLWAVANLRGGGEFGEAWHRAGMLGRKQNVFDDFEAAAEWLIRNKYTSQKKLAIQGMSNGGLLVGAALTQRPGLFQAVVCMYPLLDMLRYEKFLVARWWVPEYGSAENPEQFRYLRAYSPYQNVHPGTHYPATLFITGDGDTRVAPLHARKMTALLQASTASKRPILLLYDTKSGHSGGRPLGQRIAELTNILSFLDWQLGVAPAADP